MSIHDGILRPVESQYIHKTKSGEDNLNQPLTAITDYTHLQSLQIIHSNNQSIMIYTHNHYMSYTIRTITDNIVHLQSLQFIHTNNYV